MLVYGRSMTLKQRLMDFIAGEDPLVWRSLATAAGATILFYIFILLYTAR